MGNALTDALKFKKAIGSSTRGLYPPKTAHNEPTSQTQMLHFSKDQVHNLGNAKQGDKVSVVVHGTHGGFDSTGAAKLHVSDIKPDTRALEKRQYPEQKVPARGVESRSS